MKMTIDKQNTKQLVKELIKLWNGDYKILQHLTDDE
jgi:hypothetical protein